MVCEAHIAYYGVTVQASTGAVVLVEEDSLPVRIIGLNELLYYGVRCLYVCRVLRIKLVLAERYDYTAYLGSVVGTYPFP